MPRPTFRPGRWAAARFAPAVAASLCWAVCAPMALAQTDTPSVVSAEGELAPGQTVEIRVGRWDPVQEAFLDWEGLGGRFLVGPGGALTLPIAGTFDVSDMAPEDLGAEISTRLRSRLGTRGDLKAIVTIAAFAPIYVLGDVRAPGVYTHAPGMSVLQALALAGGINTPGAELLQGGRSALASLGTYQVLEFELLRRLATLARLDAEMNDTDLQPPPELTDAPLGEELVAQEREILEARRTALQSSLSQIDDLEVLLEQQIVRLNTQADLREEQLGLLEENLADVTGLLNRGLSTADRADSLQRQVADQRVRLLEVETARLNGEQRLNETRRDRLELTNQRRRELVEGTKEQQAAIRELRVRMRTEAALFADSAQTGTRIVQLLDATTPTMQITRVQDGESTTSQVERSDLIRGGDVLEVMLPVPETYSDVTGPLRRSDLGDMDLPEGLSGALGPDDAIVAPDDGAADPNATD